MHCGTTRPRWQFVLPKSLEGMQREVDQLLDNVAGGDLTRSWRSPLSLWEEDGELRVELDLPGVKLEDVDVSLDKNVLTVKAERQAPPSERKRFHDERRYGATERQVSLPETVDPESIEASLRDGVLSVSLKKKPEAQPRKIVIKG